MILKKRQKYLQVALNNTLAEAEQILYQLPDSERILIEAGTPLIKVFGMEAVSLIKSLRPAAYFERSEKQGSGERSEPGSYIVADSKTADLADREVQMASLAGASGITCLGVAPMETIDLFIKECRRFGLDSMIDMMNVESPLLVLKKLKKPPDVVILHRGVDETEFSKEKQIPYYQIKQIKGNFGCLVAVAGGDTIREVQRAIFNDADIVIVWKEFYQSTGQTGQLAQDFLKEIK